MKRSIFQICTLALGMAAVAPILPAQDIHTVEGVWDVTVTVTDCQTGNLIRTVHAVQMFSQDGSFSETANTFLRGSSLGTWTRVSGPMYSATYWFFRYKPDGTFASTARGHNTVVLAQDGSHLTASGTVQDYDNNNVLISTGCVVHAATRLVPPLPGN